MELKLNSQGFITYYLVSGLEEVSLTDGINAINKNQLWFENYLRLNLAEAITPYPNEEIQFGKLSELNLPWTYYYSYGNWFVDFTKEYSQLTLVKLVANTKLIVKRSMQVKAILWSYGAIDLWLNKEHISRLEMPVYDKIHSRDITLNLSEGSNDLYIKMQNLGVRDTRNIFGIQLLENLDEIRVALSDEDNTMLFAKAGEWLNNIFLDGKRLTFDPQDYMKIYLTYDTKNKDLTKKNYGFIEKEITGLSETEIEIGNPYVIISIEIQGKRLSRKLEVFEDILPQYQYQILNDDERLKTVLVNTAAIVKTDRHNGIGFSMNHILARKSLSSYNNNNVDDEALLYETLDLIERRVDCSDFVMSGLIRYIKNYDIDHKLFKRIQKVFLGFRYWMNEPGIDGMCFWSENHALLFYANAMNAGEMFPTEVFEKSNKTGNEFMSWGRSKVLEWLEDIDSTGFEEFTSGGYISVTFAALLNVIDYGDEKLSILATKVTNKLLSTVALHTFKGSMIAPQGRVYGDVIYPFFQSVQGLIYLMNPSAYSYHPCWLSFLVTSKYKVPTEFKTLMEQPCNTQYQTGNALVKLNKQSDYLLTSVQSSNEDGGFTRWENIYVASSECQDSYHYTKSLNELYHGTSYFQPGKLGYQQHMWVAALEPEVLVFVNHPGGTSATSLMRPGYWYGNGVMPAVKQKDNYIASIYVIPKEHPIHFTHIFWPYVKFDEVTEKGQWLVGRKGNGFLGIWCSGKRQVYNDQIFNVEHRVYEDKTAYLCICSSKEECHSLDSFLQLCYKKEVNFDTSTLTLTNSDGFELSY